MGAVLEISGLAGSYAGILTIVRYGLPYHLPPILKLRPPTEAESNEDDRRNLIGCGGVLLYSLGVAFQIVAVLMK
jgi:hypothetical protein